MKNGIMYVISGPSGSGKGTIVEILRKIAPEFGVAVSATTRAPRVNEQEGVNYYYRTREEFMAMVEAGEILEHTEYNGNYYGTLKSEVERITEAGQDVLLEIEVDGGAQVKRLMGDTCVSIMLIAPSAEEQERRLRARGTETEDVIAGRLARAKAEIGEADKYDYVVVNETGKEQACAEEVLGILQAEHRKSARMRAYISEYFK